MAEFNSPIFGKTRHATEEEKKQIIALLQNCPVSVFQLLNSMLNAIDLMISITGLDEETHASKDPTHG
jgi:hypothetical protein